MQAASSASAQRSAAAQRLLPFHAETTWDGDNSLVHLSNKSPIFDADWVANGYMDEAVELIRSWCAAQPIEGLTVEVVTLDGRTPLIYMEVPGEGDQTVLMYGHLDKQPEMTGWADGLDPWTPVSLDPWTPGPWISEPLDHWAPGPVDPWSRTPGRPGGGC